ncbi:LacI family DNA-binding transcriptional regulator [Microbacterium sp. ASV81]|uniref:Substrate-binding domain-containing protein n=1 Tax=Microbacterium capsulatum TaxID=3041921 RepID=A0ABU0XK25_9MICO|nr:substrate-binding domain-containing protein [Microbacterium sp. ASV81]MDQ4215500.1 substrate-binding domain-containing protein [Microbacterium sp. ASV81]
MPRPASDASLLSLARALELSTATVSNAFNRPERVGAATLARILAEADRIGYAGPDPAARQLRRGRADAVGLVLTDELPFAFEDHAAVGFLAGVAQACEESGRSLVMLPSGTSSAGGGGSSAGGSVPSLGTVAIDGVIVYSVGDREPLLAAAKARRLPIVVVDQPHADPAWDWVGIDDRAVGFAVGEHLARLGHRRVGVVAPRLSRQRRNGPVMAGDVPDYAVLRSRIAGLREGLARSGSGGRARDAELLEIPVEERTISGERGGAAGFEALMVRHPALTAVFCLSDELALGALGRAAEMGIDVPGRVSIVGVDDIERAGPAGLTTIEQPLQAKGAVAGRLLMARIDERLSGGRPGPAQAKTLPTTLHVRTSTGPPAG